MEIKGKTNIITDELTHGCQQRSTQIFHREQRVQIPLPHLRHVQHKADTTVETDISRTESSCACVLVPNLSKMSFFNINFLSFHPRVFQNHLNLLKMKFALSMMHSLRVFQRCAIIQCLCPF